MWFLKDEIVDLEVRGAINAVEACAQTDSLEKIVFTSSLTAAIWKEDVCSQEDVDEKCWSNQEFCRKLKVWFLQLIYFDYTFNFIFVFIEYV